MDLSPKLLTDVQFREQWHGYNPDEVDEFLERVASGVAELQQRLVEEAERAATAERRLLDRSDEDEIRRTLVLAQRTAVASMEEARVEADRLVSDTEARCRQLVADAEAQAARLDADIATRRRVELGDLAEQRAAMQLDIENLQAFVASERERVAEVLRGQVEWLESGYSLTPTPAVSGVAPPAPVKAVEMRVPEPIEAPIAGEPFHDDVAAIEVDEPFVEDDAAVDDLRLARDELADALRRAGAEAEGGHEVVDAPLQLGPQQPRPALFDDRVHDTGPHDVASDEPADQPQWRDDTDGGDDDPFLAELRRAVVDTEPLGPRDHHHPEPADHGDDEQGGGFFRRGRRRS